MLTSFIPSPAHLAQMQKNQQQQQAMMQQMQREGSDIDINGQRPRTPSLSDNAPSPSKRPRLDGAPFNAQQLMANGRIPPQALQGPQMASNTIHANNLLMQHGINPGGLSETQFQAFQQQNPQVQQKSIQVYAQNLAQHQRSAMSNQNLAKGITNQPGMPTHGSPMMQPGPDGVAGMSELYPGNPAAAMRAAQAPNGHNGNHALQDYQMQLMLLEQQNKKRLLMARQEQEGKDSMPRPDGQPGMVGQPGFPPGTGMSPQGSRSGPSPNPNDQMARGTPKMGQAGLPVSPLPDGSLPQARSSPAPMMNFNGQMPPELFQHMKHMGDGMGGLQQPNGAGMRPPSSHPGGFNGAQYSNPQMEAMVRAQQQGRMPGGNWQPGAQGQAPMMQPTPQSQQPPQMGTPQQRNAMPPPQAPPAGAPNNGRPASPQQTAAPPTSQTANKPNPKGKKDTKERKVGYNPAFASSFFAAVVLTWHDSGQRKKDRLPTVLVRRHLRRRKIHLQPQLLRHLLRLCIRARSIIKKITMAHPALRPLQPRAVLQRPSRLSNLTPTLSLPLLQSTRLM